MKIAMIGGGYVGLVSGACFAAFGTEVAVVEADPQRLQALRQGRMPIYEPGLTELVAEGVAKGHLTFGGDLKSAVRGADAVFIAVGTPTRRGDGHADLTYVYAAAEQVAQALDGYAVVVTKSTVPVGTGRRIATIIELVAPGLEVDEHSVVVSRYETGLSKCETRWGTFTDPWTTQPQPRCGFVICGSDGTLACYDYDQFVHVQTREHPAVRSLPVDALRAPERNPVEYFLHCITTGTPLTGPLSPAISRIGQQIVDSAVLSAREKRTVALLG